MLQQPLSKSFYRMVNFIQHFDYKVNSADYLDAVSYQLSIDLKTKEYLAQRRRHHGDAGAEK